MALKDMPIRQKLMAANLLTCGAVVLLTCTGFILYEFITLHRNMITSNTTRAQILAANCTASLAFMDQADAAQVLSALRLDPRMIEACLYDNNGKIFAAYPANAPAGLFPAEPGISGYRGGHLDIFCPVTQGDRKLGVIYIQSNLSALTDRYKAYAWLAAFIVACSLLLAYFLSRLLQKQISVPLLSLAGMAQTISLRRDFSLRAPKLSEDELGKLTDAFNQMLDEIQTQAESLRASEANYREIFEKANDAIFVHEIQTGRVLEVNQRAVEMTGYSRVELTASHPVNISSGNPGFTLEDAARWMRKALAEGPQVFEWQGRHKDGSTHWVEVALSRAMIRGEDRLLAFFREIGDRKKAEETRKNLQETLEKTQLLDSILKNIGDGVVVANEKGEFILFNQAAERLVGLGPMAGGPDQWTEQYGVFRPDGKTPLPTAENPMARAIRGEATNNVELFLRNAPNPDGLLITITGRPLKDEKGVIHGGVVVFHDMTERRKAEEAVKQSNDFLNAVLENIPNMIFVKDAKELRFVRFNKAGEELLGVKREDLAGKNDYDFFPKKEADFFTAKDREVLDSGKLLDIPQEPIETQARGKRLLHTKKMPILDLDGKPKYLLGISEDITESKRQEELRMYTRALEVSNKELQDFVFVASHDLQEPLRKIQSFGEFLQEEYGSQLEGNGKDYLERMRSAAGRMQTLISDLLTLTRVTTKAKPFEPTDLSKVLKDVLSDLELRIHEKKARVEVGPLPTLEADSTQMRQLFQNLIGNALKFQKPGVSPMVRVEAEVQGNANSATGHCLIRVKDNGIGFENRYADQIFKVFERLHGRDEYEGTGIGLAVCRKVVERHGGSITAEGFPGEGAVFTVTLPLQQGRKG